MSLAERYSRAARSSDLELKVEISDVDYLIAAGLVPESLGTMLIRLRAEFDAVGRDRVAMRLLRSWAAVRDALIRHASNNAPARLAVPSEQAVHVAVTALDLFLVPACQACGGRGFTGGYGVPTIRCTSCRESGKRLAFWRTEAQEAHAQWLQASMESKIDDALAYMRRLLRNSH